MSYLTLYIIIIQYIKQTNIDLEISIMLKLQIYNTQILKQRLKNVERYKNVQCPLK